MEGKNGGGLHGNEANIVVHACTIIEAMDEYDNKISLST